MGHGVKGFFFTFLACYFYLSWYVSLLNSRYGICVGYLKWLLMDRDNGPPNDENEFSILIPLSYCDSSFKNENEILVANSTIYHYYISRRYSLFNPNYQSFYRTLEPSTMDKE